MSKSKVVKKPRSMKASEGVPRGKDIKYKGEPSGKFQNGNQAWAQRAKHGRDKLFASPALLKEAALEYFDWCNSNPMEINEARTETYGNGGGSSTIIVGVPIRRPYSWYGLCAYVGCNEAYFRKYRSSDKKVADDLSTLIDWIGLVIANQQIEGATVGAYNANIVSRLNGLVDRQSTEHSIADDSKKHFPFGE